MHILVCERKYLQEELGLFCPARVQVNQEEVCSGSVGGKVIAEPFRHGTHWTKREMSIIHMLRW